jgi:tRNA pseudouridine55 synthase
MHGFLNLNKPAGLTSHDCVARVRRLLRTQRVGHGGTLDPAATGVLPIALGKATRLLQYLSHEKSYRGTVRFGVRTTTDDLEGEVISVQPVPDLTLDQVLAVLPQFQGKISQIPPHYSAIQVGGKRLYDLARAGEEVEVPVRTVEVKQIEVLDWRPQDFPELEVAIDCGTGTYIRAIARDWGEAVQTGGTLAALLRTRSSGFDLTDSLTLEALEVQVKAGEFVPIVPEQALLHLGAIELPDALSKRWGQGQKLAWEEVFPISLPLELDKLPSFYRVHDQKSRFLGIGQIVQSQDSLVLTPKLVWDLSS